MGMKDKERECEVGRIQYIPIDILCRVWAYGDWDSDSDSGVESAAAYKTE